MGRRCDEPDEGAGVVNGESDQDTAIHEEGFLHNFPELKKKIHKFCHEDSISLKIDDPRRILIFHVLIGFEILTVGLLIDTSTLTIQLSISSLATILASLLAIIFAISLVAVQLVSNNYSPRIIDIYKKNPWVIGTLGLFVSSIIIQLFFSTIPQPTKLVHAITFSLFFLCSYVFVNFFFRILMIIDPLQLAEILDDENVSSIHDGNLQKMKLQLNCIGDITIKTIERKEELITQNYLGLFSHVLEVFFNLDEEGRRKLSEPHPEILDHSRNVTDFVHAEMFRIFRISISKGESTICDEIFRIYGQILHRCFSEKEDIFENVVNFELNSIQLAIAKKDESRFTFIEQFIAQPLMFLVRDATPKNRNYQDYLDTFMIHTNRMAIHNDDFEFFMMEMQEFFSWPFPRYGGAWQNFEMAFQNRNFEDYCSAFFESDPALRSEMEEKFAALKRWSSIHFIQNFDNYPLFEKKLDALEASLIEKIRAIEPDFDNESIQRSLTNLHTEIEGLKRAVKDLFYVSIFYRTFFIIGAYITTRTSIPQYDTKKYMLTYWADQSVLSTEDYEGESLEPFVVKNSNWLTQMLLFGGENNEDWIEKRRNGLHLNIDEKSLIEFYLICISKNQTSPHYHLELPSQSDLQTRFTPQNDTPALTYYHRFAQNFIDKSKKLMQNCDNLIEHPERYDFIFNNQAKESFKETRKWLEESVQKCSNLTRDIESVFPIDGSIAGEFIEDINSNFKRLDRLEELTEIKDFDEASDGEKSFIKIYNPKNLLPKRNFIRTFHVPMIGFGRAISFGILNTEIDHISSTIFSDERIQKEDTVVNSVEHLFEKLPSIINAKFVYSDEISLVVHDSLLAQLREKKLVTFPTQITIAEDWVVKIFHAKSIPINQIIVLQRKAGVNINKKNPLNELRLFNEIKEHERDKTKVLVNSWTISNYTIFDPEKIWVIRFSIEKLRLSEDEQDSGSGAMDCWQARGNTFHE